MLSNYRTLLRAPHGARMIFAAAGARIPQGMIGLSLLLFVARYQGLTTAGVVVALYSAGVGILAPFRGRVVDRVGARTAIECFTTLF